MILSGHLASGSGHGASALLPTTTSSVGRLAPKPQPAGYVASVLGDMYGKSLPRAAQQLLKEHTRLRSSSAPPKAWATTGIAEDKPRRRVVDLKVPRVGRGGAADTGYCARPPRPTNLPKRKSHAEIVNETNGYERQDLKTVLDPRKDGAHQKQMLQDVNSFQFGSALPNTHAPPGMSPMAKPRRRVAFTNSCPASREGSPRGQKSGMSVEQESMASEIVRSVRERQQDLDKVDQVLQGFVSNVEGSAVTGGRRQEVHKKMANASKQRLELKSAIQRDLQDLDKLMELAPGD